MFYFMNMIMSLGHHIVLEIGLDKFFLEEYEFAKLEIISDTIILITLCTYI